MSTFFLEEISKTVNLDANLLLRQYKLDLMSRFMKIKSINQILTQKQIAKGYSDSTLIRYRDDIKMRSPYKSFDKEAKIPQMTSNEPVIESLKPITRKVD